MTERLLSPLSEQEAAEYNRRIERGFSELWSLCAGRNRFVHRDPTQRGRDFTLTIPVQDTDSDVVLADALQAAKELLAMYGPVGVGAAHERTP